ncbi:MAG TPA: mechanosensitive ion channel domain-containing protein [candidate division Zixibacteria bacterium]|nr:mechanosensitive ion channel domain-containing protein [candidate division Zixibacteria bacterium]
MLAALLCCALYGAAFAEAPATPAAKARPAQQPIPLSEVALEAEFVAARLRDGQAELLSDAADDAAEEQLPSLVREIDARLRETRKVAAHRPSLETLRSLDASWRRVRGNLSAWTRKLADRAEALERELGELQALGQVWELTLAAARQGNGPPEIVQRIETTLGEIREARAAIVKEQARALAVQSRIASQDARVGEALALVDRAHRRILDHLLVRDGAAIWSRDAFARSGQDFQEESRSSFAAQWTAVRLYAERQRAEFFRHVLVFLLFWIVLAWVRRRLSPALAPGGEAERAGQVLKTPVAVAFLLSFFLSRWIYPEAPRLLWAALEVFALLPSALILRRLIGRDLHPAVYAVIGFYFLDRLRAVLAAVPLLPRLVLLLEMLGTGWLLLWLVRSLGRARAAETQRDGLRQAVRIACGLALGLTAGAFAASALGYVTLGNLLGNALLDGAYLALVLYVAVEIAEGLFAALLLVRPAALLGCVSRHRPLLRRRARRGLQWLAVALWSVFLLERLLLRERVFDATAKLLAAELAIGSLRLSLGDALAFAATVWGALWFSRFVRFVLEEDVYPRVSMARGLPYAISTVIHYLLVFAGFFVAVAALGVDMTRFTILAGAFTVAVGFGLQNIFNNFVSGLILLFERPVNVGDVVQIDDTPGVVEHIGIRASLLRTPKGSMLVVPNGKLISERVINWSLANPRHGIELPVAVACGTDPKRVISLLEETAAAHPAIAADPPPQALVVKLGPDAIGMELRAWTDRLDDWMRVRSELAIRVSEALAAAGIALR